MLIVLIKFEVKNKMVSDESVKCFNSEEYSSIVKSRLYVVKDSVQCYANGCDNCFSYGFKYFCMQQIRKEEQQEQNIKLGGLEHEINN